MSDKKEEDESEVAKKRGGNTLRDLQKTQLDKLMANPERPVYIPERPEDWKPKEPPEFVRFYMGSSAGAGSEVFHVYRHLRRRENIRQQHIEESAVKDDLDMDFLGRVAKNRLEAEARTQKKRAKRLKKKMSKKKQGKVASEKDKDSAGGTQDKADSHTDSPEGSESEEAHFVIGGR